jgi:Mn2+/Fe2+ NRAMP family transporter
LLFNIPLEIGVLLTARDVLLILYLQKLGFRPRSLHHYTARCHLRPALPGLVAPPHDACHRHHSVAGVTLLYGEAETGKLLLLSQVILSLQLPFAVVPLVQFTADKAKMGALVAPRWLVACAVAIAVIIIALNLKLLWQQFGG